MGDRVRIAAVLIAAGVAFGCKRNGSEPPIKGLTAAQEAQAKPTDDLQAMVTASRGRVQITRDGGATWTEVKVGDRLGPKDALRTDSGEVDLAIDGVKVRVHESSKLELSSIAKRAMRGRIHGSLESDVEPASNVDVDIGDTDATAHSEGGHFFVTDDGKGVIAVAAVTGSVHLTSKGKSVEVQKGEVSRITTADAGAPSKPAAALRRVLLAVQWPNIKETNQPTLPISGRVEPGSRVFVQGEPVVVDVSGAFRSNVALKQGKQKIAVVTVDALGRRKEVVGGVVKRDDSLPGAKVKKKLWQWR
jgi:hypothetical protein